MKWQAVLLFVLLVGCSQKENANLGGDFAGIYKVLSGRQSYQDSTGQSGDEELRESSGYIFVVSGGPGVAKAGYCMGVVMADGTMECSATEYMTDWNGHSVFYTTGVVTFGDDGSIHAAYHIDFEYLTLGVDGVYDLDMVGQYDEEMTTERRGE